MRSEQPEADWKAGWCFKMPSWTLKLCLFRNSRYKFCSHLRKLCNLAISIVWQSKQYNSIIYRLLQVRQGKSLIFELVQLRLFCSDEQHLVCAMDIHKANPNTFWFRSEWWPWGRISDILRDCYYASVRDESVVFKSAISIRSQVQRPFLEWDPSTRLRFGHPRA